MLRYPQFIQLSLLLTDHSLESAKFKLNVFFFQILQANFGPASLKIHPKFLTNNLIRRRFFAENISMLYFFMLRMFNKKSKWFINEHILIRDVNGNNPIV